jgi:YfiH family protein
MTGRQGGVSRPPYDSLNLGYHIGDDPAAVAQNRARAAALIGLPNDRAVFGQQLHSARIARVTREMSARGWDAAATAIPATDALFTSEPGVALGILAADCFPVAIWDVAAGVLGVAHCGWRGVAAGLPGALIDEMARQTDLLPARCQAWVGAGIGPGCFQVGPEVLAALPGVPAAPDGPDRWRISLFYKIRQQLVASGILFRATTVAHRCTACETDAFFSHRRATKDGLPTTGRQALFAWRE